MSWRLALVCAAASLWPEQACASDADPWFAEDKYLHGGISLGIAGAGYGGAAWLTPDRPVRALSGFGAAVVVGGAKELWDMQGHGDPSWRDFTWDVAGGVAGVGLSYLLDLAICSVVR